MTEKKTPKNQLKARGSTDNVKHIAKNRRFVYGYFKKNANLRKLVKSTFYSGY